MAQKILKVGSSAAVTIPKRSLDELGLKVGDQVSLEIDKENKAVTIKPALAVSRELIEWIDKFISRYRRALEALAKK